MTRLSLFPGGAIPSVREQAHHALTLLGVPATARLVVGVHAALFSGDLSVGSLAGQLRHEERTADTAQPYHLCGALNAVDLAPASGFVALSNWPLAARIVTATSIRLNALTAIVRVAEFAAVRCGASRSADRFLRDLAAGVPGGPEAYRTMAPGALADAARAALAEPALADAVVRDRAVRDLAAARAARLDQRQQLFGVRILPRPRDAQGSGR